jgi:hypothetical protein
MYGEKPSHPIYIWNGILEPRHLKRLGPAFSLFVWLIDKTTKEQDGIGAVLGGMPLKADEIGASMGVYEQTIRRRLDRLEQHGYIERTLTPHGYVVRVKKSCKFPKRSQEVVQNCPTSQEAGSAKLPDLTVQESPTSPCKTARPNKSKQLSKQKEEAVGRLAGGAELWTLLGIRPEEMPPEFRELCEGLYANKNGQPMSEFVGVCMDLWVARRKKIPPRFAREAKRIREEAKNPPPAPIKPLPEMPFQTKKVGQCQPKT